MTRIRLSTNFPRWPLARQTPGGTGRWGECVFTPGDRAKPGEECDYWVVCEGLSEPETATCPPGNVILFTGEPGGVRSYEPAFLEQFAAVVTSQPLAEGGRSPTVLRRHQALPWHVGVWRGPTGEQMEPRRGYDELKGPGFPPKTRDLSVVCSAKAVTEGHRNRVAFVQALKEKLGDRLDWFGRGYRVIEDKWDAVAPYRFHLALENCAEPHYWTEKLADSFLGGAFPIYFGCPNLGDYFPAESFMALPSMDGAAGSTGEAIARIELLLREGLTPARLAALDEARRRVLDDYNLYAEVARLAREKASRAEGGAPRRIRLRPERFPGRQLSLRGRLSARIRRLLYS